MQEIYFSKIWHYTLFNIGNNEMMVSNLVVALLMLWFGMKCYNRFVSKLYVYISNYLKDDLSTALILQRIITYIMVFVYGIFILDLANIPISSFAFLGGTIALSIGLGAQTLMGNFLSGLLVVMEKSLKIGDVVEIEGVVGVVQSIGIRSTRIKASCDSIIIIPNSHFVNNLFAKLKNHKNFVENKADIAIELDVGEELELRDMILQAVGSLECISNNPKPSIYLVEINNKKHIYSMYFYPKISEQHRIEYIRDMINEAVKQVLGKVQFSLTYPYKLKVRKEK